MEIVHLSDSPTVGELIKLIVVYSILIITTLAGVIVFLYLRNQKQSGRFAQVVEELSSNIVDLKHAIELNSTEQHQTAKAVKEQITLLNNWLISSPKKR